MNKLNFPDYEFSITEKEGQQLIFDPVRKKYVVLTPEEWVRQHMLQYLLQARGFPSGLVSVEGSITVYKTNKRYDIAAFDRQGEPILVVECKSPSVTLNQAVVDQVIRYNLTLQARFLVITNGLIHLFLEKADEGYIQIKGVPDYSAMQK